MLAGRTTLQGQDRGRTASGSFKRIWRTYSFPEALFSLILCLQYLQRSLFQQMAAALRPGGVLVFETFTKAQLNYSGGPRNPAYLLESGELRTAFPGLHTLFYRELNAGQGIASLVAQKPQKKG